MIQFLYFLTFGKNNYSRSIISTFDYNGKRYLLYTISKDEENDNVLVSELIRDSEGYDTLKDIEDTSIKEELDEVVKRLLRI